MASEASLKLQLEKLEKHVQVLTNENQSLKSENKALVDRVVELEKKLNIQPTLTQTKSPQITNEPDNKQKEQVQTIKESPVNEEPVPKVKEENVTKPATKGWPNVKGKKKDDSDTESSEEESGGKFVPENKKKNQDQASDKFVPETRKKATTTSTTTSGSNKKFESNISSEKLLTPSFGGGVYIPPTGNELSTASSKPDINAITEETKDLDKTLKTIGDKTQVKFVTKWISNDENPKEEPKQVSKESDDATVKKVSELDSKKRNTVAVSNPTKFQSDLENSMSNSLSLNIVWKNNDFAELSKYVESKKHSTVTDIKLDLNGANTNDSKNVMSCLKEFINLKDLEIKGMSLETKEVFSILTEGFVTWSKLECFKLQHLKGSALDAGLATKFTDTVRALKTLKELRINCRSLTPDVELQLKTVEKLSSKFQVWAV